MGRCCIALAGALIAILLAAPSGAEDPAPPSFPPVAQAIEPAGALFVDGRRVHAATFVTDDPVEVVIAGHEAAFAGAPVDLHRRATGDGAVLSILDVHGGRHLVVEARRRGGRTEVVRGWTALGAQAVVQDAPLPLPRGFVTTASVEDHLGGSRVRTQVVLAPAPPGEAVAALAAALVEAGWRESRKGEEFVRLDGARLEVRLAGGTSGAVLRIVVREET